MSWKSDDTTDNTYAHIATHITHNKLANVLHHVEVNRHFDRHSATA